jgi:hypothetical protein
MKKILLPLLLVAGCLLSGCEKEVTGIKLPESNAKLVVTSFISPQDTAVQVRVTRSQPVIGYQEPLSQSVPDANVTISNGTQTRQLAFTGRDQSTDITASYLINTQDFPIVAGATYTLRVSVPGGETVEATCTVPEVPTEAPSVTIDSVLLDNDGRTDYFLRMDWVDVPGQENYYRPMAEFSMVIKQLPPDTTQYSVVNPGYWEGEVFLSDQGKDGERLYAPKGVLPMGFPGSQRDITISLFASLLHTDQNYFRYHRSLRQANRSQDNPFAEPVLVYSNVTGGLGVFAAYNRATVMMRVR